MALPQCSVGLSPSDSRRHGQVSQRLEHKNSDNPQAGDPRAGAYSTVFQSFNRF